MKRWLAQGSSGRRVTLLPGTTFLHINGALLPGGQFVFAVLCPLRSLIGKYCFLSSHKDMDSICALFLRRPLLPDKLESYTVIIYN